MDYWTVGIVLAIAFGTAGILIWRGKRKSTDLCPNYTDVLNYAKLKVSGAEGLAATNYPATHRHIKRGCCRCWGIADQAYEGLF